ncbi:MAG: hypothetical protein AAFR59_07395 [Bacteroidota bacterium]
MIRHEPSIPFSVQMNFQHLYPEAILEDAYENDWGAVEVCFTDQDAFSVGFFNKDGDWLMTDHYLGEHETPYFMDYYLEGMVEKYFSAIAILKEQPGERPYYLLEIEPESDQPPMKIKFTEAGELIHFWQVWREEIYMN